MSTGPPKGTRVPVEWGVSSEITGISSLVFPPKLTVLRILWLSQVATGYQTSGGALVPLGDFCCQCIKAVLLWCITWVLILVSLALFWSAFGAIGRLSDFIPLSFCCSGLFVV